MTDHELDLRLAELLRGYGVLPAATIERAQSYQTTRACTLAGALVELRLVADDVLCPMLEELTGARAVDPTLITVYQEFVERMNGLIPATLVSRLLVFPAQMDANSLHVCMLNPTDASVIRALEAISGCRIHPFVTHQAAMTAALKRHYAAHVTELSQYNEKARLEAAEAVYRGLLSEPFESYLRPAVALVNRQRDAIARDPKTLASIIREPVVIRLVQQILCRAIEAGASDVHVEPGADDLRIRVRLDGAMQVAHRLPPAMAVPLVARLKVMADLPIVASTSPLDARIAYDLVWGRGVDLRFSLVPSVTGEKVVLRVLDRSRERRQLADLGVDAETRALIERAADLPNGLLLVTGPTGSGKSSTLYALIDRLNDEETCILTAEDPVESGIAGVTQVHCDETSGVSFASALRSFLRQDPDVLMVGEIRDAETADLALKAALTGHLVLSTLHTNDAPGAVLRLINMNLEPFLIASALRLVAAQRLIRRLCHTCRVRVPAGSRESASLMRCLPARATELLDGRDFYEHGPGCAACSGLGYRGRIGIFEVLRVTEAIEELIIARASATTIRAKARAEGMRTLREAGWQTVADGETSIAEVLEHTAEDGDGAMHPAPENAVRV